MAAAPVLDRLEASVRRTCDELGRGGRRDVNAGGETGVREPHGELVDGDRRAAPLGPSLSMMHRSAAPMSPENFAVVRLGATVQPLDFGDGLAGAAGRLGRTALAGRPPGPSVIGQLHPRTAPPEPRFLAVRVADSDLGTLDTDLAAIDLDVAATQQIQQPAGAVGDACGLPLAMVRRQTDGRVRQRAVFQRYGDGLSPAVESVFVDSDRLVTTCRGYHG